jgi:hypothetical protein
MSIKAAIEEFTERLHHLIEGEAMERARAAVLHAFGAAAPKKRGRPKALAPTATISVAKSTRKKSPPQLCPVPYCRNPAAPIFGMVCAKHKDVPKALIKKYREARRAKKEGVKVVAKKAPARRAKRVSKKPAKLARPVVKKAPKRRAAATKKTQPIAKETPTAPEAPAAA